MYWTISILWAIIGTMIYWGIISKHWNQLDIFEQNMIPTLGVFHPIPQGIGFIDLKFSMLRHAFVFLLSSVIIYFAGARFIRTLLLLLNVVYASLSVMRFRYRKQDLLETETESENKHIVKVLTKPVNASKATAVHAVLCAIILHLLSAIRP